MERQYNRSLFIFRRDLRLQDNTGLIAALKSSAEVIPCFIFDPNQIESKNKYRSDFCIQFMLESLIDLQQQLDRKRAKLFLFYGEPLSVIQKLIHEKNIHGIFLNSDYTPFSKKRDLSIFELCQNNNIDFHHYDDALLHSPQNVLKSDNTPYLIFTPYYRKASLLTVNKPQQNRADNYYRDEIKNTITLDKLNDLFISNSKIALHGGRQECKSKLKAITHLENYALDHNFPSKTATTMLSAHLKFTTCSVREIYHYINETLENNEALIRELYWRDFFTMIAFYFPYVFGHSFHRKYDSLNWRKDGHLFRRWCHGETGFPIVDAGMRQLNETGYMHNRVRLISASFLIKDLHFDWRTGEKYFAQHLVDYDPAVNNGNWQWVAGTGCDAQPYFRIFNPWLQQKKFDPDCKYIKKWLPELQNVDNNVIHKWYNVTHPVQYARYPIPMLNHEQESRCAKIFYDSV